MSFHLPNRVQYMLLRHGTAQSFSLKGFPLNGWIIALYFTEHSPLCGEMTNQHGRVIYPTTYQQHKYWSTNTCILCIHIKIHA